MSTDILYRKAFIKIDDKRTIPVFEAGSSNCTTINHNGREVLARDWSNHTYYSNGNIIAINDSLLNSIDNERVKYKNNKEYDDKLFGWFGAIRMYGKRSCTFNEYKNYFLHGIKTSMTIEEYAKHDIRFSLRLYSTKFHLLKDKGIEQKPNVVFLTTEQLIKVVNEYTDYYKNTDVVCYITLDTPMALETMKMLKKYNKNLNFRKAKPILFEKFYTIVSIDNQRYFARNTKYGYKYSSSTPQKRFDTEKNANKFLNRLRNSNLFQVKYVE